MHPQTLRIYEAKGLVRPAAHRRQHAPLLRGRPRAAAAHPAADDRARAQPRRRRARDPARGADAPHAADDGAARARDARADRSTSTSSTGATSSPTTPRTQNSREQMDFQKLTIKSQEAIAAAQELARRRGNPEIYPEHLLLALLDQELPRDARRRAGRPEACGRRPRRALRGKPVAPGRRHQQPQRLDRVLARCSTAPRRRCGSSRTSSSRPSTCCSRSTSCRATSCSPR